MKNLDFVQHPGEILREELETLWISFKKFAEIIGKSASELSELLNWKRNITASWAILLETSLWISSEFWLWMQKDYEIAKERKKIRKWNLDLVKKRAIKNGIMFDMKSNEKVFSFSRKVNTI